MLRNPNAGYTRPIPYTLEPGDEEYPLFLLHVWTEEDPDLGWTATGRRRRKKPAQ